ncbi:Predicted methyltransferase [Phaffia rhodozyma]|uniref:RNA methyltransferase n=1 Tax=Phaffia rhodozyma TaxID=264483 RepID=A0A0F7SLZ5_PHARH|nr:Predicted methyltransferase [Phaffia rhodozyma]
MSANNAHGNYSNYYTKRQASLIVGDRRVDLLPLEWIQSKKVLDIGCNAGFVSVEIAQRMSPESVLGVDIDPSLIKRCETHLAYVHSLQAPSVDENYPTVPQPNYFPIALPKIHGFIPLSESRPSSRTGFPRNISFRAADWVVDTLEEDQAGYDLILALSLTKWIHLHHADSGLMAFFKKIYTHLTPGGRLVLEPQSFKGYKDAAKKAGSANSPDGSRLRSNLKTLKLRPEDFGDALVGLGFKRAGALRAGPGEDRMEGEGEADEELKGFDRPIEVYVKPSSII